jgi:DNA polymerase-3 subunit delta'
MSWNRVIGQQRVKDILQRSIQKGQVAHSYLFHGSEGVGKDALAIEFARALNCQRSDVEACEECPSCRKSESLQHPNINLIFELPVGKGETKDDGPLDKLTEDQVNEMREQLSLKAKNPYHRITIGKANTIKISSIREIRRGAALTTFERGRKVFIISNAENMNLEASNSLLKTLEEPPSNTILILTSSEKSKLLPTIVSRCQPVQFSLLSEQEIRDALVKREGVDPQQAAIVAGLAEGSYAAAQALLSRNWIEERRSVVDFLRAALGSQPIGMSTAIDLLTTTHDRTSLERWLKVLQSWLREALILRENGDEESSSRHDGDDIRNFNNKFPRANLILALEDVERHIALLNKNVYLPLVLTNLSINLKKHLSLPSE